MNRLLFVPALLGAATFATAALAQPPQDALPLSQILASLEEQGDVAWFDEVEWESEGYWKVEYFRTDGGKVEIRVDPQSGEPRQR